MKKTAGGAGIRERIRSLFLDKFEIAYLIIQEEFFFVLFCFTSLWEYNCFTMLC